MDKTRLVCLFVGIFLIGSIFSPVPAHAGVGVTPTALSFGSVTVNTTSTGATVVITNSARQSVTIQQVASSLPEFIVISPTLPMALSTNASASFQVLFKPDAAPTVCGENVNNTNRKNRGSPSISGTVPG